MCTLSLQLSSARRWNDSSRRPCLVSSLWRRWPYGLNQERVQQVLVHPTEGKILHLGLGARSLFLLPSPSLSPHPSCTVFDYILPCQNLLRSVSFTHQELQGMATHTRWMVCHYDKEINKWQRERGDWLEAARLRPGLQIIPQSRTEDLRGHSSFPGPGEAAKLVGQRGLQALKEPLVTT